MLMKVSIQYPFSLHDSSCSTLGEITMNSPPCPGKLWFGGELPPGPFQTWCHGGHVCPSPPKCGDFLGGISRSPEIYGNLGLKNGPRKRSRCLFFTVGPKLGQLLDWVKIDPSMKSSKYSVKSSWGALFWDQMAPGCPKSLFEFKESESHGPIFRPQIYGIHMVTTRYKRPYYVGIWPAMSYIIWICFKEILRDNQKDGYSRWWQFAKQFCSDGYISQPESKWGSSQVSLRKLGVVTWQSSGIIRSYSNPQ